MTIAAQESCLRIASGTFNPAPMKLRTSPNQWAVGLTAGSAVYVYKTEAEAEKLIAAVKALDPTGVANGDYFIDGPEG